MRCRTQLSILGALCLCALVWLGIASCNWLPSVSRNELLDVRTKNVTTTLEEAIFRDLNEAAQLEDTLIIMTPMKNAARHLDKYFRNLDKLTFPKNRTTLSFLVGDSDDGTVNYLLGQLQRIKHQYRRISVFRKDFRFYLPETTRHGFDAQVPRRKVLSKARNYLLTSLRDEKWVVWLDVDVAEFPVDIIQKMMAYNKDVLTANCFCRTLDGKEFPYDNNAWHETPDSQKFVKSRPKDEVLLEGYYNRYWTHRMPLTEYKKHPAYKIVRLDAVGGTFLMVRADVHRAGANFPAFPLKHAVETEGFGQMANMMGFGVYGLPHFVVYHPCNF